MSSLVVDTEEQRALRKIVAQIAERYGADAYRQQARAGESAGDLYTELGAAGLLGVHLPTEYGGGGAGLSEAVIVSEELAAHGMPSLLAIISPAICGSIINTHGSHALKQAWLPGLADGTKRMSFALTEPDAGSNSHQVRTTARRSSDGWVISGGKYYISAMDEADAALVVTKDADLSTDARNALSLFIVPTRAPGLSIEKIDTALVSTDRQFTVFFDELRIGPDSLIGEAGRGLRQVFAGLNPERILAAALCNGVGRYAIAKASDYARTRQVWSAPIGAHQGVAHPLAETYISVELARLATQRTAQLADEGAAVAEAANMAKFSAAEAALAALDQSIQTHGGNGLSNEYGLAELWFITRLMRTAPVSREMVLNFIAQTSLGLPRSY